MSQLTEDEVFDQLKDILVTHFSIAGEKITPSSQFRGTFGMDSLDIVDLVFFLQKQFGISGELEEYRELHTVKKLCAFVVERRGKRHA